MKQALPQARLFQAREVAALVGTTPRRVEGWVERNLIKPRVRGRGKGSRHGFDAANVIEAVILLAAQEVIGEHSPATEALMMLMREHATWLAGRVFTGWVPTGEVLVIFHTSGGPAAALKRDMGPEEETAEQLRKALTHSKAVTYVGLTEPLTQLAQRLKSFN